MSRPINCVTCNHPLEAHTTSNQFGGRCLATVHAPSTVSWRGYSYPCACKVAISPSPTPTTDPPIQSTEGEG